MVWVPDSSEGWGGDIGDGGSGCIGTETIIAPGGGTAGIDDGGSCF